MQTVSSKNLITHQRDGAKRKQGQQADKMFEQSTKIFKQANIGDTVMVPLPEVDRGKGDFRNIKAIVVAVEHNSTYKLGTKYGLLNELSIHIGQIAEYHRRMTRQNECIPNYL